MNEKEKYWVDRGFEEQCWGYPILDWVWNENKDYPKKYQPFYRIGQIQAHKINGVERPWFYVDDK